MTDAPKPHATRIVAAEAATSVEEAAVAEAAAPEPVVVEADATEPVATEPVATEAVAAEAVAAEAVAAETVAAETPAVAAVAKSREPGRWRRRLVWIPALVAAAFAGWSGWAYWQARHDDSLSFAQARDELLRAGRLEIAALNSIDGRQLDAGLRRWLDASTGPLHDELQRSQAQSKQQLQRAGTSAQGTVTDAAVTQLDTRSGTAQIIASVQIRVTPPTGPSSTERKRYQVGLDRTPQGWKLKSLVAIPVGGT
jgi:Mce-associated membrane protein